MLVHCATAGAMLPSSPRRRRPAALAQLFKTCPDDSRRHFVRRIVCDRTYHVLCVVNYRVGRSLRIITVCMSTDFDENQRRSLDQRTPDHRLETTHLSWSTWASVYVPEPVCTSHSPRGKNASSLPACPPPASGPDGDSPSGSRSSSAWSDFEPPPTTPLAGNAR